ncbi:hypothetical protein SAE02_69110 [Skermanella aerolata]|uniref:Uncharacterized protein n=1 Tax=Skermanella aerolata TaxID=393310 RepID=A0A512E202_9PROT|nr:hypothetical protein [Skermanella aerolata]KJB91514.1 hypothetical protein N826_24000 [Skermanella aerolata KACC 11604]GEO42763.1 hypothetical protein SAE02_69110 [Skermanella aerolata]
MIASRRFSRSPTHLAFGGVGLERKEIKSTARYGTRCGDAGGRAPLYDVPLIDTANAAGESICCWGEGRSTSRRLDGMSGAAEADAADVDGILAEG